MKVGDAHYRERVFDSDVILVSFNFCLVILVLYDDVCATCSFIVLNIFLSEPVFALGLWVSVVDPKRVCPGINPVKVDVTADHSFVLFGHDSKINGSSLFLANFDEQDRSTVNYTLEHRDDCHKDKDSCHTNVERSWPLSLLCAKIAQNGREDGTALELLLLDFHIS